MNSWQRCQHICVFIFLHLEALFRIRIDLNTDPDPAFEVNTDLDLAPDGDLDPGFFMTKIEEIFYF